MRRLSLSSGLVAVPRGSALFARRPGRLFVDCDDDSRVAA